MAIKVKRSLNNIGARATAKTKQELYDSIIEEDHEDEILTRFLPDDNPYVPQDHITILDACLPKDSKRVLLGYSNHMFLEFKK